MKILHTSDWHVGKTLARRSRLDEAREVLTEIVDIAEREAVDAVLVCGDVFDHIAPSAAAEKIVYDTLVEMERREIPVLLVPGNHDHARRWRALEPLLRRFMVRVVPEVRRPDAGGIVRIDARDNSTELQIAVLPWVFERQLFGARELMGLPGEAFQSYAEEMRLLIEKLCEPLDPSACTAFAGHLFVSGSRPGEGTATAYDRASLRHHAPGATRGAVRGPGARSPSAAGPGFVTSPHTTRDLPSNSISGRSNSRNPSTSSNSSQGSRRRSGPSP